MATVCHRPLVIPGLVPGIHEHGEACPSRVTFMDCRDEPGNDKGTSSPQRRLGSNEASPPGGVSSLDASLRWHDAGEGAA